MGCMYFVNREVGPLEILKNVGRKLTVRCGV
jgi:hypothetical protein